MPVDTPPCGLWRGLLSLPGLAFAQGVLQGAPLKLGVGMFQPDREQNDARSIGPGGETADRRARRRDTGLLMQGLHLLPRLSARENVLIGALALRSGCRWYPQDVVAEADAALAARWAR